MTTPFTFGSLFSGIGGIDLGLERAGMQCRWQVEIDTYATQVLHKHWPHVTRFHDVRDCGAHNLAPVDLICGGFPCQDISNAGKRRGLDGERSGLWSEMYRIVCELRPAYVLVENVAALTYRGLDRVLGALAQTGYDAEWQVLPAAAFGALHLRERVFLVAYTARSRCQERPHPEGIYHQSHPSSLSVSDAHGDRCRERAGQSQHQPQRDSTPNAGDDGTQGMVAHSTQFGCNTWRAECAGQCRTLPSGGRGTPSSPVSDVNRQGLAVGQVFGEHAAAQLATVKRDCSTETGIWATEPTICRVAHGVPHRVDRLRGLGNAVVPQIAEYIGCCILAHVQERKAR